ncbi:MAG TPA: RcnB family protein [Rhizomicrobium sp.]|nr:RcnB family protein [Rhizomicrobium sp.]
MKRIMAITAAFFLALPSVALAAPAGPPGGHKPPMTTGKHPTGKPSGTRHYTPSTGTTHYTPPRVRQTRPTFDGRKRRPSANRIKPYYGHNRPPQNWHRPRSDQFFWRGNWYGRYHAPAYIYPRGYGYRYWHIGDFLPLLFLSSQYYFDDYAQLGLETPPPGYRWVRYGSDALLVNMRTGAVEDVVYGAFY